MKRILITLVTLCVALTANAQFYLGGSFRAVNNTDAPSSSFSFAPELGYNINESFSIGSGFGFYTSRTGDHRSSSFSFSPYARYTFAELGPINFFIDGAVKLTTRKGGDGSWEIGLYPGIALPLTDSFSFVAHMGQLSFNSASVFTLGLDNAVSAGLYFHF